MLANYFPYIYTSKYRQISILMIYYDSSVSTYLFVLLIFAREKKKSTNLPTKFSGSVNSKPTIY